MGLQIMEREPEVVVDADYSCQQRAVDGEGERLMSVTSTARGQCGLATEEDFDECTVWSEAKAEDPRPSVSLRALDPLS